jgi:hypothetical protein
MARLEFEPRAPSVNLGVVACGAERLYLDTMVHCTELKVYILIKIPKETNL